MVSKSILAVIVIVAIVVIGGGIYMMQQPPTPTTTPTPTTPKPAATTPTETPTTQETPTPTETQTTATTLPMSADDLVMAYVDAFNRHSPEEAASYFVEDNSFLIHDLFPRYTGREKIAEGFREIFESYPDVVIEDHIITLREITGDTALYRGEYSAIYGQKYKIFEKFQLDRIDGVWKIKSLEIYGISD